MNGDDRWLEFSRGAVAGGRISAAFDAWSFAAPALGLIRDHVPAGGRILDVGCGSAVHDVLLEGWGYQVTAIDSDPRVVEEAEKTRTHFRCSFELAVDDAADLSRWRGSFDLVYSLGVVEHFARPTTVALLREQASTAPLVLATIPTRAARRLHPQTDERNYSLRGFRGLFEEAGLDVVKAFPFADLNTRVDRSLRMVLPYTLYRSLQYRFAYALELACLGRAPSS